MKKKTTFIAATCLTALIAISAHLYFLSELAGHESFPADTYLDTATNKTALIVVAHDDDAIGCSGTVLELVKKGWKIHFLTFYGNFHKEDNPIRKLEVAKVAGIQKLASIDLIDFVMLKSDTVAEPWMPIPYSKFKDYFKMDSIKILIADAINKYQPSVLFTLDNVTGGYGHPQHACVSQCAMDVCDDLKMETAFSVKKIYQAVYTETMNEKIIGNMPAYVAAKKVYQVPGTPFPDVEINIYGSAKEKMEVMDAYESQKRNLKKIWPYYNWYPSWLYFKIFDKEYFRVISIAER